MLPVVLYSSEGLTQAGEGVRQTEGGGISFFVLSPE